MPGLIQTLLNERMNDLIERGRREVRGALFHTIAESTIRPRVDNILDALLRRR